MKNRNRQYGDMISDTVSDLLHSLKEFSSRADSVGDKEAGESVERAREIIRKGEKAMRAEVRKLSSDTEWDCLNASFFGETNAGKSTIIEALTNGTGATIGEGYKDFTKTVSELSFKNTNLLDMPGIEGRESKVMREIQHAVNKSHVVFYVIGTNKEPEERTIRKIRKFLKSGVRVYSVINVRGRPTVYKYKKELKDSNIATIEKRVKQKFREILGKNYAGNIVVNGHLALMRSEMLEPRFQEDSKKAVTIFGGKSSLEKFSNVSELHNVIECLSKSVKSEIIISNTYKLIRMTEHLFANIEEEKRNLDEHTQRARRLITKYSKDVDATIIKYTSEMYRKVSVNLNELRATLKKQAITAIDEGWREASIKTAMNRITESYQHKLNSDIDDTVKAIKSALEKMSAEFDGRIMLEIKAMEIHEDFNFEEVMKAMAADFNYVLKELISVAINLLIGAINPVFFVISAVATIISKIWKCLFRDPLLRKNEAKVKAVSEIDDKIRSIHRKVKTKLTSELKSIRMQAEEPLKNLRANISSIGKISKSITVRLAQIRKTQAALSTQMMAALFHDDVEFAYLNTEQSEAIIIGPHITGTIERYCKKLRLKRVGIHRNFRDWFRKVRLTGGSNFEGNDRFTVDTLRALSFYNQPVLTSYIHKKGL